MPLKALSKKCFFSFSKDLYPRGEQENEKYNVKHKKVLHEIQFYQVQGAPQRKKYCQHTEL